MPFAAFESLNERVVAAGHDPFVNPQHGGRSLKLHDNKGRPARLDCFLQGGIGGRNWSFRGVDAARWGFKTLTLDGRERVNDVAGVMDYLAHWNDACRIAFRH